MRVKAGVASVLLVMCVGFAPRALAGDWPTGERTLGRTTIEPAYNDSTGELIYLLTPDKAPFPSKANSHAVAPLYLIVYPNSAADFVGPMNCAHDGGDNCPDHGPGIAGAAAAIMPGVYSQGVWGHDHLVDAPGGSEFNIAWQVHLLLFTSTAAANTHITTEEEMDDAIERGDLVDAVPDVTVFNCNVVSSATYNRATPVTPVD